MNGSVLLFSVGVSVLTGLIFGLAPAVQGFESRFVDSLKDATREALREVPESSASSPGSRAACHGLILLIGSGVLIRSFLKLQTPISVATTGLLTFRMRFAGPQFAKPTGLYHGLPLWDISPIRQPSFTQVFDRLKGIPGVRSAAGSVYPPMVGKYPMTFTIEGRNVANADD